MFDWQNIIVAILITGALIYVGRRAFRRLGSMLSARAVNASCETGCGKCESASAPVASATPQPFVQLQRSHRNAPRRSSEARSRFS